MEQKGVTLWFTGLSGAGKTTISRLVAAELGEKYGLRVQILDGDVLREEMGQDLGFTREERFRNIRRAAWFARTLNEHGVTVLASFITPYRDMRDHCRKQIARFYEIYVKCSVDDCIERDVKGLYKKALSGVIPRFTGISDPYEEPWNPDLTVDTSRDTPVESARQVLAFMERIGLLPVKREDELP
jgi:adenylylsulfate kinase